MMVQPVWIVVAPAALLTLVLAADLVRVRRLLNHDGSAAVARLVVALLVCGVGLRPAQAVEVPAAGGATVDVVLMVDRTASMGVEDLSGNRARAVGAGADLTDLVGDLAGANFTVIAFDDDARISVPFTTDATAVASHLQTLGWVPPGKASGSDISVGVELAAQVLSRSVTERPGHARYLVYAGDGEQTQAGAPTSFEPLAALLDDALVLGYGSTGGAPVPVGDGAQTDSDAPHETVQIDGEVQRSRIDRGALRTIAVQLGGEFTHRTSTVPLPVWHESPAPGGSEVRPGSEYHWILALAALPFLLFLLGAAVVSGRRARDELADLAGPR